MCLYQPLGWIRTKRATIVGFIELQTIDLWSLLAVKNYDRDKNKISFFEKIDTHIRAYV